MMMIELSKNRTRYRWRKARSLINLATSGLLLMISAARCHAQSAPSQSSLALRPQSASQASGLNFNLDPENAYRLPAPSVLENIQMQNPPRHRFAEHALTKIAQEIQKMQRRNIEDPFDHYRYDLEKFQNNYSHLEASANSVGVDREALRQGIGITTATIATAFGALYVFKPIGLSDYIPKTRLRVGYDVSQLEDPGMLLSYDDRYSFGLNRNGFGGSFKDRGGRLYSADLNLFKMRAILKLNF